MVQYACAFGQLATASHWDLATRTRVGALEVAGHLRMLAVRAEQSCCWGNLECIHARVLASVGAPFLLASYLTPINRACPPLKEEEEASHAPLFC